MPTTDPLTVEHELIERINRLVADKPAQWGRMNAGQMLAHCADQLRICLGERPARRQGSWLTQRVLKFLALHLPMKLPRNLKAIPELDPNGPLMTKPTGFEHDRTELLQTIHQLMALPDGHPLAHPVFGAMTKPEVVKLSYVHLDHHLRQFGV